MQLGSQFIAQLPEPSQSIEIPLLGISAPRVSERISISVNPVGDLDEGFALLTGRRVREPEIFQYRRLI